MTPELINQVFHPERPVVKRGLLVGRTDEVAKTIAHMETVGGHVLLCGHRGIGKTSIAKVAEVSLRERHASVVVVYLMCDQRITFDVIVDVVLSHAKIPRATLHIASPAFVAAALADVEGFLLIDEAERLNVEDRLLIAELMKSLSDLSARFSLCVVGVARTALELFHQHPSIQRCLTEVPVRMLQKRDVKSLIEDGFGALGQRLRSDTLLDMVRLSRGFPSHAVSLSHHLATHLLTVSTREADPNDLRAALRNLLSGSGAAAAAVHKRAVATGQAGAKEEVLLATSYIDDDEFTIVHVMQEVAKRSKLEEEMAEELISELSIDGPAKVFDIVVPGLYAFNNPRMPTIIQVVDYVQNVR